MDPVKSFTILTTAQGSLAQARNAYMSHRHSVLRDLQPTMEMLIRSAPQELQEFLRRIKILEGILDHGVVFAEGFHFPGVNRLELRKHFQELQKTWHGMIHVTFYIPDTTKDVNRVTFWIA